MEYNIKKVYGEYEDQWFMNINYYPPSKVEIYIAIVNTKKEKYAKFIAEGVEYLSFEQEALLNDYSFTGDVYPMPSIGEVLDSPLVKEISRDSIERYGTITVRINSSKTRHFIIFGEERFVQILFNGDYIIDDSNPVDLSLWRD